MQVILEAVQRGEPTAFFCKLGKDRTGLISMLVLSCCGATEDEIVSDYVRCHVVAFSPLIPAKFVSLPVHGEQSAGFAELKPKISRIAGMLRTPWVQVEEHARSEQGPELEKAGWL